jgi:hypothetical protein
VCIIIFSQEASDSVPLTVYSLRFSTGFGRGAALSDFTSGINVCLVANTGRAVLHRISPVNDPSEARHEVETICSVRDLLRMFMPETPRLVRPMALLSPSF